MPSVVRYVLVKNIIKSTVAKYRQHKPEDDDENEHSANRHVGAAEFAQNAKDLAILMERYGGK